VMSDKEVVASTTVATKALFLNSKPFYVLFDSGTTHSFILTRFTMQLNLKKMQAETNYRIKLPNDSITEFPISINMSLLLLLEL